MAFTVTVSHAELRAGAEAANRPWCHNAAAYYGRWPPSMLQHIWCPMHRARHTNSAASPLPSSLQNRVPCFVPVGPDTASLIAAPLDPLVGAFGIVNALRPVQPLGGEARVLLAFSPPDCCEYQETLTLRWVRIMPAANTTAVDYADDKSRCLMSVHLCMAPRWASSFQLTQLC